MLLDRLRPGATTETQGHQRRQQTVLVRPNHRGGCGGGTRCSYFKRVRFFKSGALVCASFGAWGSLSYCSYRCVEASGANRASLRFGRASVAAVLPTTNLLDKPVQRAQEK